MKYSDVQLAWLAGLLEGEGSFNIACKKYPVGISLSMTDKDIIETVAKWWGVSYNSPKARQDHHKQVYKCSLRGQPAVDLMKLLLPYMGSRRSSKIVEAIASHKPKGLYRKISVEDALEVRDRYRAGEKAGDLGVEFGVSKWTVYSIHQGRVKLDG